MCAVVSSRDSRVNAYAYDMMDKKSKHKAGGSRLRPFISVYLGVAVGRDYIPTWLATSA